MKFTEQQIQSYALPAIIKEGRRLFEAGAVQRMHSYGNTIVAEVKNMQVFSVVVTLPTPRNNACFECTCSFIHGGACEHSVAVMAAVNARDVVQTSLFHGTGGDSDHLIAQNDAGSDEYRRTDENEAGAAGENAFSWYDEAPEGVLIQTLSPKPIGRIYLSENGSDLVVELRCAYATGFENRAWLEFTRIDQATCRYIPAERDTVVCVERSRARENMMYHALHSCKLTPYHRGTFVPTIDTREWVADTLPKLDKMGFEIYGHKKLVSSTTRYNKPGLRVSIKAEGGAFTCSLSADFSGIPASLAALIHAVKTDSRYVLLNDGSSGTIPRSWGMVLKKMFTLVSYDRQHDEFLVPYHHLPLLDLVYDLADQHIVDDTYRHQQELLKNFTGVEPMPCPDHFNGTMRLYQHAGYEWFYFLRKFHFGGCLADDMGLGKTIQTLALLQNEKNQKRPEPTSIVVVPTSVLHNWEHEARLFTPLLLTAVYYGHTRRRIQHALTMADVILTTYGTLVRDSEILGTIPYNYIILDEAQTIKNPSSRVLRAVRELKGNNRLALTGTPVENSLSELWSMFSFLNPGMFGPLSTFRSNIVKPIEIENDQVSLALLNKMVHPFILRRTKQQVARELPPRTVTTVYTDMLPKQRHCYEVTREAYLGKIVGSINDVGIERSGIQIIEGMLRLRQICCHPGLIDPGFTGDSGKFILFDTYLDTILAEDHRVLVFSQFESVLELVRTRLHKKRIPYEILTGRSRDRQKIVTNFKQGNLPVFLISLKAGGVGLNLTEADYVIHLDPWWNPAVENQASDRAHRIGQTREVFVYKFITVDSIEERVIRMQSLKQALSDSIIHAEQSFYKHLTKQEILSLFS